MSNQPDADRIDSYLHGLLDAAAAAEVERLVASSPEWAAALEQGRRRLSALDALSRSEASEDLVRRTLDTIERRSVRRRGRIRSYFGTVLALTALGIAVLVSAHWHYAHLTPSPIDLRAFGQNELLAGSRGSLRMSLARANSGTPVAGAAVQMVLFNPAKNETVRLADFQTDTRGSASPRFALPDWPSGQYVLRITAQTDAGPEELARTVTLKRESKLLLSSDKPLYQPGQTIHLRALALRRPDLKPVSEGDALFTISDPQGNVIFKRKGPTSRFGITSADCPLATEILEGAYQIACKVGDTESALTVQVEKYVLPKFKVAVTLDQTYYQPGQAAKATVQADYFFGKPVAAGELHLVARAADIGASTLSDDIVRLDEAGRAELTFGIPEHLVGSEQTAGDAKIEVVAEVTDTAGQKQAVSESRIVTTHPVRVEVIPESGTLVKGVVNTIYVLVTYADGRPVKAAIHVNEEEPFETNALGVGSFELTPKSNEVSLTVAALEGNGLQGHKHVQLACGVAGDDFLVRTDKAVYRGGETLHLQALGGGGEPVFVDLLKDRQTLLTQVVDVKQGRGETAIDLPADCFGTLELYAYCFGTHGVAVMKTRSIVVEQPNQLKIAVERDSPDYRPGQTAKLKFALTDDTGKPTPGALSLAAVDEAVFHVLKQRPGLEGTFFNLNEDLLKPVYAIYPWSPFAGNPADREQLAQRVELERALFSRTSRTVQPTPIPETAAGLFDGNGFGGPNPGNLPMAMPPMVQDMMVEPQPVDGGEFSGPAASPLTLAASTYPAKANQVSMERIAALDSVRHARNWLIGLSVLSLLVGFAIFKPRAFLITAGVSTVVLVIGFGVLMATMVASPRVKLAVLDLAEDAQMAAEAKNIAFGGMGGGFARDFLEAPAAAEAMFLGEDVVTTGISSGGPSIRVRKQFPETLLWQPQLITDDNGRATLEVPLADSITNWRLSASAVSAAGQLGALQEGVRVFQPFFVDLNLPVALTRNDEVAISVVVYNYLSEPQTVELVLERDEWFDLLAGMLPTTNAAGDDDAAVAEIPGNPAAPQAVKKDAPFVAKLELAANEIRSLSIRIRASQVGRHSLQATARSLTAPGAADALRREIAVEPDGTKVELVQNGSLSEPVDLTLAVSEDAIPGSAKVIVKLYPSSFSQLVEGLDAIFQMPSGCFEQTSSTTYPNILALDYLKRTKKAVPDVEAKARQYIHLGYQRLMGFEVTDNGLRGGFDWFGNPPANQTLTAYGLLEFTDMAKVHDVDPTLIDRTRQWLLGRRQAAGSWKADIHMLNDGLAGSVQRGKDLDLATTAYVAWAVFGGGGGQTQPNAPVTLNYLLAHSAESIDNPYALAMVANAIAAIDPKNVGLKPYLARLDSLKKTDPSGKKSWWELPAESQTCFYGSGGAGNIEVTALATLALLEGKHSPATVKHALTWLVEQKDARGTWQSTQATVLALKALIQGTTATIGDEKERIIDVLVDGEVARTLTIPADQADVMQQLDLSPRFATGAHRLTLKERTDSGTGYQVAFRHHVPGTGMPNVEPEPLKIDVQYDKTTLAVNDFVTATATVTNTTDGEAPMVILDLPVPAGFRMATDALQELVSGGKIAKFQQNARTTTVYLRTLKPGDTLTLNYRLEATLPVKLTVPAPVAYEYYNPAKKGTGKAIEMVVNPMAF